MRLLDSATQEFREFFHEDLPPYAILSHTWEDEELSYSDMLLLREGPSDTALRCKPGWRKIELCCRQAREDGLEFVWLDTCCIDKSSSAELQEAINSMFRWYEMSTECYVFLADFDSAEQQEQEEGEGGGVRLTNAATTPADAEPAVELVPGLGGARWFSRGWTLQELLAPESVRLFDRAWRELGDKVSLRRQIASITGIREDVLLGSVLGARQALDAVSVAQRMSWAANRVTTRVEDTAYCLLGIFDVNMPLLYGEGPKAFQRLQEEIMKLSADQSLLAWGFGLKFSSLWGVSTALARSPADFAGCGSVVSKGAASSGVSFSMTQRGLLLDLPVAAKDSQEELIYCVLNCTTSDMLTTAGTRSRLLAVPLFRPAKRADGGWPNPDEYYRMSLRVPMWVDEAELGYFPSLKIYLPRLFRHGDVTRSRFHFDMVCDPLPQNYMIGGVFPPEASGNDCIMSKPWSRSHFGNVFVHFISRSRLVPDFVVSIWLGNWAEVSHVPPRTTTPTLEYETLTTTTTPRQRLTYPALRDLVLNIVARSVHTEASELSETQQLEDVGVDSLASLEIAMCLRQALSMNINSDLFYGSNTIGDVLKKLRFVTRPSFAFVSDNRREESVTKTTKARLSPAQGRISVYTVDEGDSLPALTMGIGSLYRNPRLQAYHQDSNGTTAVMLVGGEEVTMSLQLDGRGVRLSIRALPKPGPNLHSDTPIHHHIINNT